MPGPGLRNIQCDDEPVTLLFEGDGNHGRSFAASLPAATRFALTQKNNRSALFHLFVYFGLLALFATLILAAVPFWWLLLLPHGIVLAFLFTLEHEATHKTPFASEWINELAGRVAGLLIVQPFIWFRYFHFAHHRHTNNPDKDPELAGSAKPQNLREFTWHISCIGYWQDKLTRLWRNAYGRSHADYVPPDKYAMIRTESRVLLPIYLFIFLFTVLVSPILFWIWFLPLLIGLPFLRIYLLAEHGLCPLVANMFDNTRTTYTNAVVRFLAWNMPYHTEHHDFPAVPFHQLPSMHRLVQHKLLHTSCGYSGFVEQYLGTIRLAR